MLPNFRGDLVIGQLDHDFDGKDVFFHPLMLETFCHLTLGFAGTKSQDGVCAVNNRADRIVKVAGLIPKLPELYIFRRAVFGGGPTGKKRCISMFSEEDRAIGNLDRSTPAVSHASSSALVRLPIIRWR